MERVEDWERNADDGDEHFNHLPHYEFAEDSWDQELLVGEGGMEEKGLTVAKASGQIAGAVAGGTVDSEDHDTSRD